MRGYVTIVTIKGGNVYLKLFVAEWCFWDPLVLKDSEEL